MKKMLMLPMILLFVWPQLKTYSQSDNAHQREVNKERNEKQVMMKDESTSPLTEEQRLKFDSLSYFPINDEFKITAEWYPSERSEPVTLQTSSGGEMQLEKTGSVRFEYGGEVYSLDVFASDKLPEFQGSGDIYFIPFMDQTSGRESNGSGRYVRVDPVEGEDKLELDFNRSINPFSAYNEKYSGLVPPPGNRLMFSVVSGERKYEHR
ncbi:MAG: DUF1684 domain-containing protein [Bacteroidales bacterium]|nr:DUF1684 domain-containing protein [Bacteroidales bacterium]